MSAYTTQDILQMIEEAGDPRNLDLSEEDLSSIDLGPEMIWGELEKRRQEDPEAKPRWVWQVAGKVRGINLQGARLSGANLERAKLIGASLDGATLVGANLRDAKLFQASLQRANLMEANLRGAELIGANLRGTWLYRANLKEVNLLYIESAAGAHWYGAQLDRTEITWRTLGPATGEELLKRYGEAQQAYLTLKNNFESIGRYDDAAWAYQKERQMEKHTHWPRSAGHYYEKSELTDLSQRGWRRKGALFWFYARHSFCYCADWAAELICGYGESVIRVLFTMLAVLGLFSIVYWSFSGFHLLDDEGNAITHTLSLGRYFLYSFLYSLTSFTTAEFPRLVPACNWVGFVSSVQALVGIALTGLLGFVLGNRIRRS